VYSLPGENGPGASCSLNYFWPGKKSFAQTMRYSCPDVSISLRQKNSWFLEQECSLDYFSQANNFLLKQKIFAQASEILTKNILAQAKFF